MGGLVLGEDGVGVGPDAEVPVLGGEVDPLLVVLLVGLDVHADGLADEAGASGDHDDVLLPVGGALLPGLLGGWLLGHGCVLDVLDGVKSEKSVKTARELRTYGSLGLLRSNSHS